MWSCFLSAPVWCLFSGGRRLIIFLHRPSFHCYVQRSSHLSISENCFEKVWSLLERHALKMHTHKVYWENVYFIIFFISNLQDAVEPSIPNMQPPRASFLIVRHGNKIFIICFHFKRHVRWKEVITCDLGLKELFSQSDCSANFIQRAVNHPKPFWCISLYVVEL